jgi:hypothetical protein
MEILFIIIRVLMQAARTFGANYPLINSAQIRVIFEQRNKIYFYDFVLAKRLEPSIIRMC